MACVKVKEEGGREGDGQCHNALFKAGTSTTILLSLSIEASDQHFLCHPFMDQKTVVRRNRNHPWQVREREREGGEQRLEEKNEWRCFPSRKM